MREKQLQQAKVAVAASEIFIPCTSCHVPLTTDHTSPRVGEEVTGSVDLEDLRTMSCRCQGGNTMSPLFSMGVIPTVNVINVLVEEENT